MNEKPMLATPVYPPSGFFPHWLRLRSNRQLPRYVTDCRCSSCGLCIFDHWGETIIDGRRAFVTEPYARGNPGYLQHAADIAGLTDTELRICLPTWHGYGTMRFAWLAPRDVVVPKYLTRFVSVLTVASSAMHQLASDLPAPDESTFETLRSQFWAPLWHHLTRLDQWEVDTVTQQGKSLLQWHGYRIRRKPAEAH